ncbi:hypothetical protein JX265_009716 [Neoarthrinium moseri]|uniref:Thioredoxin domain-containing protein n=1 Tax=Neoarthrinium moseri TaxID=1658444 RepID=A0A9Q0AL16_9PEZI|nr:uncharacterized protein JN550_010999 [Neoarthrinium moseri]KAI1842299.1 hypothetical protein JX266_011467 [Neoarthrinium moseri]KAI1861097.1 hypothetical protein JX265_009716 [Neoarthrinium moseri]KAI1861320.1 hypothetical protein JN550_010999 [Neoarthrinium moseri]
MSAAQEWDSWKTPPPKDVKPAPKAGEKAPVNENLTLPSDKPTLIVFLRHCGCPFAEKTFKQLTNISAIYKGDLNCVAVSHSSQEATERWVIQVGGNWDVTMVVDHERELYAQWGLGISNTWHVLSPASLYKVFQLGKSEHIWNRPTESGSRWQVSGAFTVDRDSSVRWAQVAASADDMPKFEEAILSVGLDPKRLRVGDGELKKLRAGADGIRREGLSG